MTNNVKEIQAMLNSLRKTKNKKISMRKLEASKKHIDLSLEEDVFDSNNIFYEDR